MGKKLYMILAIIIILFSINSVDEIFNPVSIREGNTSVVGDDAVAKEDSITIAEKYNRICNSKEFTQKQLSDIIKNIHEMNWSEYYAYSIENENFQSIFWSLRDFKFDEETLLIILTIQGTDGGIDEEYIGLIDYIYNIDEYKKIVNELILKDPIAEATIIRLNNAFDN